MRRLIAGWIAIGALWCAAAFAQAQAEAPEAEPRMIEFRLVAADAEGALISDLEQLEPIPVAEDEDIVRGQRAVLWVRGASVDGKFTFERYYQGKYINRSASLAVAASDLGEGEHAIWPGDHRFTLHADGSLTSEDPDITIDGDVVSLRCYPLRVLTVDAAHSGPAESRLIADQVGVYTLAPDFTLDTAHLPDLKDLELALSHARVFEPLTVYVPANEVGQGYLLYPSWQALHVKAGGSVALAGGEAPRAPNITASGTDVIVPYYTVEGRVQTRTSLSARVGQNRLEKQTRVGATTAPIDFAAGQSDLRMMLDEDLEALPAKFLLADNAGDDPAVVRLLALEWRTPVFEAGETVDVVLRMMDNTALIRASDVTDFAALAATLSAEQSALGQKLLATLDAEAAAAVRKAGDVPQPMRGRLISALNDLLYDAALFDAEAVDALEVDEAARTLWAQVAAMESEAQPPRRVVLANRRLVDAALGGAVTPLRADVAPVEPRVTMQMSDYASAAPAKRMWRSGGEASWADNRLRFTVPELPAGFYVLRMVIEGFGGELSAEMFVSVVEPGQTGSASFVSDVGRDAFEQGETIHVDLVLRSMADRSAGPRRVVLRHPDGYEESISIEDAGGRLSAAALKIDAARTRVLRPGRYELDATDLPRGMASRVFAFDLAAAQPTSLYRIIKPSKYTGQMNELTISHRHPRLTPIDLDRAVRTLSELGYNQIDHMAYTTDQYSRYHTQREALAARDDRLPAPGSVYQPTARDQLLNSAVRYGFDFNEVLFSYNDFEPPRYLDGYIHAAERWIGREAQAMRHSPAFHGILIYDEFYTKAVVGVPDDEPVLYDRVRMDKAEQLLGRGPADVLRDMSRYITRPADQRDPEALDAFLKLRIFEHFGWGDFNSRLADAARRADPTAKISTYHHAFMYVSTGLGAVVSAADLDNGFHPDVFRGLDFRASVHYADNYTGWMHSPMMIDLLRFEPRQPVYSTIPLAHENRSRQDGQYQRHMALAMLSRGADGVSMFALNHGFEDGPNRGLLWGKETTKHLNDAMLAPFGEVISRSEPGYRKVGIVNTLNQAILSEFKEVRASNMIEELWLACWRLGYSPTFIREGDFENSLSDFDVIFVPAIRFDGELTSAMLDTLRQAIETGTKVVVEQGSTLDLPGITRLDDLPLNQWYLGASYAPSFYDDELNKLWSLTQQTTDYLATRLPQWTQPAAWGTFQVGPNWWSSGEINYLVMANYDDPPYGHTVKQTMAQPRVARLQSPSRYGRAAYDLLAQEPMALSIEGDRIAYELDMRRIEGAIAAFTPEPIAGLRVAYERAADGGTVRVGGELVGESGQVVTGAAPMRVRITHDETGYERTLYRAVGRELTCEVVLPAAETARTYRIEVREMIAGHTAVFDVQGAALAGASISVIDTAQPRVGDGAQVAAFLRDNRQVRVLLGRDGEALRPAAEKLVAVLAARGIEASIEAEADAYRFAGGDPGALIPMADGFHTWRRGHEVVAPGTVVDGAAVILSGPGGSYLAERLAETGFIVDWLSRAQARIDVAVRGLHWNHDTLCIRSDNLEQLVAACDALAEASTLAEQAAPPAPRYGEARQVSSEGVSQVTAAAEWVTTNEQVVTIDFDAAGNSYIITWGHGDNLYSFTPAGELRFSRYLPEAAASRLEVTDDRVLVFTSAGARLYQLTLDGEPITQVRLSMDPGPTHGRDGYALAYGTYVYDAKSKLIYHTARATSEGTTRVIDAKGRIIAQWQGEDYEDRDTSEQVMQRGLHGLAISPDGKRIAQIESAKFWAPGDGQARVAFNSYVAIRDANGRKLHGTAEPVAYDTIAHVSWAADQPGPTVHARGWVTQYDDKLNELWSKPAEGGLFSFGARGRIVADGHTLRVLDADGSLRSVVGPVETMPTHAAMSADGKTLVLLDEYALMNVVNAADGRSIAQWRVPELGHVIRFTADGQRIMFGGIRGGVITYDLSGDIVWQTRLAEHNTSLGADRPLYDPAYTDLTEHLWPVDRDEPGDLDALVSLDRSRLANGSFESGAGWEIGDGGEPAFDAQAKSGKRSLRVGEQAVQQAVTQFIGEHMTWVAEFHYRAAGSAAGGEPVSFVAGLRVDNAAPDAVARTFEADEQWRFGRLVIKSGASPTALAVGFRAASAGREVLIDDVTLRPIRFPSRNHLLHEPLYHVEPVVLTAPRFADRYDPVGSLRDEAPNRVIVEGVRSGAMNMVESAFLQNGRINEMHSQWYIHPLPGDTHIAAGFAEPRWISHVVLYFNAYDEQNITPHFDVLVKDMDSGAEHLVASVRHNGQLMHVVKFEPIRAAQVSINLVHGISRLRTLTEIEAYGPLSGKGGKPGFADPDGQNTYMGDFTRVDKRAKTMPTAWNKPVSKGVWGEDHFKWSFPTGQIVAADDHFYVSRALGHSEGYDLANPTKGLHWARAGGIGFGEHVTLYGGVLLKTGLDGRLYCIDAESSRTFWSVKVGERLTGAPVAIDHDVYIATDTGMLYRIDLASGSIMMQVELPAAATGSLATDGRWLYVATHDGTLRAYDSRNGRQRWSAAIAPWTEATPAVDKGVVYIGDQKGVIRAVDANNGNVRWETALDNEFARCPVVTDAHVIVGCRGGTLAVLNRGNGSVIWRKKTTSRFPYEPIVLDDKVLYFDERDRHAMLANVANGAATPVQVDHGRPGSPDLKPLEIADGPMAALSYYKQHLLIVPRQMEDWHGGQRVNDIWIGVGGGTFHVLAPRPEPEAK